MLNLLTAGFVITKKIKYHMNPNMHTVTSAPTNVPYLPCERAVSPIG